jgi:S1-C subfamily serine protease
VNLLDFVVVGTACAVTISGWRFGFFARFLAWAGVAVGLMVGVAFVPGVVTNFGGTAPNGRATAGIVFLALAAVVGEGAGLALAIVLVRLRDARLASSPASRLAGAACGFVGVLVLAWLVVPSLTALQGWPSRLAHGSFVGGALDDVTPRASFSTALSSAIARAPYATPHREREFDVEHVAPRVSLPFAVAQRVRESIVLVSAESCAVTRTGTGWVADRGLVMTAAHVVRGTHDVSVRDAKGTWHRTDLVTVDPDYDIAVLRVHDLHVAPLAFGHAEEGETGVVFGHPRGGELREASARLEEITYENPLRASTIAERDYVVAARLAEGDSGAPLVDARGDVVGVVFGIRGQIAFALAADEAHTAMHRSRRRTASC